MARKKKGIVKEDIPNQETIEAIEEARAGKYAGTIDATSFETFMASINSIE